MNSLYYFFILRLTFKDQFMQSVRGYIFFSTAHAGSKVFCYSYNKYEWYDDYDNDKDDDSSLLYTKYFMFFVAVAYTYITYLFCILAMVHHHRIAHPHHLPTAAVNAVAMRVEKDSKN